MRKVREVSIRPREKKDIVVDMLGEVVFDVDLGPVLLSPTGLDLDEKAERDLVFSALPDIRSSLLFQEAFIFRVKNRAYHACFIQTEDPEKKRGYVQKTVFVRCNKVAHGLEHVLGEALNQPSLCSADRALQVLLLENAKQGSGIKHHRKAEKQGAKDLMLSIGDQNNTVLDNLIRCRSFLVLGDSPGHVSDAVCALSTLAGFPFGGTVFPYKSSLSNPVVGRHTIIGVTNEYFYKKKDFDNVIDLREKKYVTDFSNPAEDPRKHLKDLKAYFLKNPQDFRIREYMEHAALSSMSLRARKMLRDFFGGRSFNSWLHSLGYRAEQDKIPGSDDNGC